MNIVKINEVKKLQKLFFEEFGKTKLEKNQISRDILFKFFKKKNFLNLYKKISSKIALRIFKIKSTTAHFCVKPRLSNFVPIFSRVVERAPSQPTTYLVDTLYNFFLK